VIGRSSSEPTRIHANPGVAPGRYDCIPSSGAAGLRPWHRTWCSGPSAAVDRSRRRTPADDERHNATGAAQAALAHDQVHGSPRHNCARGRGWGWSSRPREGWWLGLLIGLNLEGQSGLSPQSGTKSVPAGHMCSVFRLVLAVWARPAPRRAGSQRRLFLSGRRARARSKWGQAPAPD
jgi:hypothetical protein